MPKVLSFLLGLGVLLVSGGLAIWVVWKTAQKSEDPGRILYKWVATVVIFVMLLIAGAGTKMGDWGSAFTVPITAAVFGIVLGILWAPHLGALLAKPLTSFYDGGEVQVEERPFYSIARARQKQGRHQEAIAEVRKQLDKFGEDFEGWMLLGEIYANGLKDNEAAQNCIIEILCHKGHAPKNVSFALNCSADWHLKITRDREAARESLQKVIELYPDTEFANIAAQRAAHLVTDEMLADEQDRRIIPLTRHEAKIGLMGEVANPQPKSEAPDEAAGRLVQHLEVYPLDIEAREELARVYADHYKRLDLATDQLEQLVGAPGVSSKQVTRWLNLLADLQIAHGAGREAAETTLKRIIALYPNLAAGANAEKRIAYIEMEFRKERTPEQLHLGDYEKNIGLKGKVPKTG